MPTALESLISIPCKPLSRFPMALYYMYLLVTSWHGRVVYPFFPYTTNCISYTTEENFAFTDSCSFIPQFVSHFLRENWYQEYSLPWYFCGTYWILWDSFVRWVCLCGKYRKYHPKSHPVFVEGGIIEKSMKEWHRNVIFNPGPIWTEKGVILLQPTVQKPVMNMNTKSSLANTTLKAHLNFIYLGFGGEERKSE